MLTQRILITCLSLFLLPIAGCNTITKDETKIASAAGMQAPTPVETVTETNVSPESLFPLVISKFRFVAFGDYQGVADVILKNLKCQTGCLEANFYVNTGDIGTLNLFDGKFPYGKLYPAKGNNDDNIWASIYPLPEPIKDFYSFNYGNTHFVMLYSGGNTSDQFPPKSASPNCANPINQTDWAYCDLESVRNESSVENIIVVLHMPPLSFGGYGSNTIESQVLIPIFKTHPKLRAVLSGHNHFYQRIAKLYALDGTMREIRFLVIGGAGAPLYTPVCSTSEPNVKIEKCEKRFHSVVFDVNGTTIQGRAIGETGQEFDSFFFLAAPQLVFKGTESYAANGKQWVRYKLAIANKASIPAELFAAAPDLPPCGLNPNASRTWVDIFNATTNQRLNGFCALTSPQNLDSLWFAIEKGTSPPQSVYVVLTDRRANTSYRSNSVSLQ